jgi:hypothetical protein
LQTWVQDEMQARGIRPTQQTLNVLYHARAVHDVDLELAKARQAASMATSPDDSPGWDESASLPLELARAGAFARRGRRLELHKVRYVTAACLGIHSPFLPYG